MPLNKQLHDRLTSVFGSVRVCSEGEPFIAKSHKRAFAIPGSRKRYISIINPGEYYAVNCPVCGDTRGRLWINHRWNTTFGGMPLKYLVRCYNEQCDELPDFRETLEDLLDPESIHSIVKPVDPSIKPVFINEYPGTVLQLTDLPEDHRVIIYLSQQRGFDIKTLNDVWGVRWIVESEHKHVHDTNRLVVPIKAMEDGEEKIMAWQTRWFDYRTGHDTPPTKKVPKYLIQGPTRLLVYNLHRVKQDFIVICEGVFDAMRIGVDHGVCTFGKTLSAKQADLIEDTIIAKGGRVIFAYDPDVGAKQWKRIQQRVVKWPNTMYMNFPDGVDIADYSQDRMDLLIKGLETC